MGRIVWQTKRFMALAVLIYSNDVRQWSNAYGYLMGDNIDTDHSYTFKLATGIDVPKRIPYTEEERKRRNKISHDISQHPLLRKK